jgi:hypothetical protein
VVLFVGSERILKNMTAKMSLNFHFLKRSMMIHFFLHFFPRNTKKMKRKIHLIEISFSFAIINSALQLGDL